MGKLYLTNMHMQTSTIHVGKEGRLMRDSRHTQAHMSLVALVIIGILVIACSINLPLARVLLIF